MLGNPFRYPFMYVDGDALSVNCQGSSLDCWLVVFCLPADCCLGLNPSSINRGFFNLRSRRRCSGCPSCCICQFHPEEPGPRSYFSGEISEDTQKSFAGLTLITFKQVIFLVLSDRKSEPTVGLHCFSRSPQHLSALLITENIPVLAYFRFLVPHLKLE